ncbi:MAG: hypothetical protein AAGA23_18040 [Pseudomonadota bacterium]
MLPLLGRIGCALGGLLLLASTPPGVAAEFDSSLLAGLKARNVGPAAMSGRIAALDALNSNPNFIVAGAATGGVWISENGGLNWTPVFDEQPFASIGALAINQANPDIIWVGTGESNVRNSTSIGGGVFKSVDRGRSWKRVGLENSERIDRIALHPNNPDIAYVAALGPLWGPGTERGIYRTRDGGATWERVLYVDDTTGGTDVKLDPANPHKIYAALWQFRRWPYQFKSGGPGSGLYVSHDGGDSWVQRTTADGLPEGELGRMVVAPSPADPQRVWVLVEAQESAVLRSDDGGHTFARVNSDFNIADRPFYYTELFADPSDPNRVYNISTRVRTSIDGGKTFEFNPVIDCCAPSNTIHIDNHAFWINPRDPRNMILGNDGGIAVTRDRGETWRFVRNLPLAQFYHIAVDNDDPYHIYGGLQDNGSWRGPAEVRENAGIRNLHWQEVGFGDGFDTLPDPRNSRQGYSMSQGGYLYAWNLDSGEVRLARPAPPSPDVELRFNWNAGLAIDPFDPDVLYYGSQFLHQSTDRGASWTVISGDLTSNNPDFQKYKESGGITPDVTAAENYTSIVAVAPSPVTAGVIWVGTDDGRIHVTRDGGESWDRIDTRARGVPAGAWVPMIHASPHDAGQAHIVFDDHRRSDMGTYVMRADNYGARFRNLSRDEDLAGYAHSILQDPVDPALLFLGTELGLYVSTNGGDDWSRFTAGVPTVSVMDMAIQAREVDLVLGTHGRAAYVIDDYRALRGLEQDTFGERFVLLSAGDALQYNPRQTPGGRFPGSGEFRAANEPYGAMITFIASGDDLPHPDPERERGRKAAAEGKKDEDGTGDEAPKLTMTVADASGTVVRTYRYPVHQGINRIVWDTASDGVRPMPRAEPPKLDDGLPGGPPVVPGVYKVTLAFDGVTQEADVEVKIDPNSGFTAADRRANYEALQSLQELDERVVVLAEKIVRAREDVRQVLTWMKRRDKAAAEDLKPVSEAAEALVESLTDWEKRLRVPAKTKGIVYDEDKLTAIVGTAQFYVGSSLGAPTETARVYMTAAAAAVGQAEEAFAEFQAAELAGFADLAAKNGLGLFFEAGLQ